MLYIVDINQDVTFWRIGEPVVNVDNIERIMMNGKERDYICKQFLLSNYHVQGAIDPMVIFEGREAKLIYENLDKKKVA
jgi:hypothetical protein